MTVSQIGLYPNKGGSLQTISKQIVNASVGSISFPDIPPIFSCLRLVITGSVDQSDTLAIGFNANGDVGANYNEQTLVIAGTDTIPAGHGSASQGTLGVLTGTGSGPGSQGSIDAVLYNYSASGVFTNWIANCAADSSGVATTQISSGYWMNPQQIKQLTVTPFSGGTFAAGTTAILYGLC